MSIKSFFATIFHPSNAQSAAIANAPVTTVAAIQAFAGSTAAQVIAGLKETDIGAAVANDISAIESSTMTGPEKFASVVENTVPLIVKYAAGGGVAALEADVEGIARGLVQTIYLDVQSTSFGKLAKQFLHLLGI